MKLSPEERKERKRESKKRYLQNMTDEQKEKRKETTKEYSKRYRQNMTEEQKEKGKESNKRLSPEERKERSREIYYLKRGISTPPPIKPRLTPEEVSHR